MMNLLTKRRAISPAVTTLILLGVAVGGGLTVYGVFQQQSSVAASQGGVSIESVSLVRDTSGDSFLSLTYKNAGNTQIQSSVARLQVDTDGATGGIQPFTVNPSPAAIDPGDTASISLTRVEDTTGAPIALNLGDSVPIEVQATGIDGSIITRVSSATVSLS